MKKTLLVAILSISFSSFASPIYLDKNKTYTDLDVAFNLNQKAYMENVLKTKPNVVYEVNNSRTTDYIGFNLRNKDILPILLKADNKILTRTDAENRNVVLGNFANYYNTTSNEKEIKMLEETKEEIIKAIPEFKADLSKSTHPFFKTKAETEDLIINLLESGANVNVADKFGNNALHYAVYYRMDKVVEYIIKDYKFTGKNASNLYGEPPVMMLLTRNCNTEDKKMEETEVKILNMLYAYNKLSFSKRNKRNVTFAGMVFYDDKLLHLRKAYAEKLSQQELSRHSSEGEQIKAVKGDQRHLTSGYYNRNLYNVLSCK